ncbi:MAG: tetratricopeptide repeat protein [Candidatus Thorarchaeota archaeon]|jgi:cytochrome c-type biogenesis protein CcmH/NrfG
MLELALIGLIVVLIVLAPFLPSFHLDMVGHFLQGRPEDVEGWVYYGSLLEKNGHEEAAAAAYRAAIKLLPSYKEAWFRLANVLTKLGDFAGADEAFKFAI